MNEPRRDLRLGPDSSTIDQLVASFVERLRNGEQPPIDEYQRQYPHLADEIGQVFPPLQLLEQCRPGPDVEDRPAFGAGDLPPQRLGEYQILRELGRGGMGIVYEAMHAQMKRRVALKVLPKSAAEQPTNEARFLLEARAAGQLHHTNIVPVFEVDRVDGFHFYAMQYIEGQNLDLVIEEMKRLRSSDHKNSPRAADSPISHSSPPGTQESDEKTIAHRMQTDRGQPSSVRSTALSKDGRHGIAHGSFAWPHPQADGANGDAFDNSNYSDRSVVDSSEWSRGAHSGYFRRVAAIGMQIANALAYAHHHRVLHRDIKPSNLILDTDGVVWITDFGLAKQEDDGLTKTGDIVGTLKYMAPERFKGRTDALSDIYSLGLTLYELCTLRNAFEATSHVSLIEQITQHAPPAPRSVDATIPKDLETIVLKATDRVPERRYRSAERLAEDLQAFISDRPIRARRISNVERLWRLCRRNPITAILTAASLAFLVTIAVVSTYFSVRLGHQSEELAKENQRALAAERDARRSAYDASLGQAKSLRRGRLPGQHFESLAAVRRAANNLEYLPFSDDQRRREKVKLRSEATAALSLTDLSRVRDFGQPLDNWWSLCVSHDYQNYAQPSERGEIVIARLDTDEEMHRLPSTGHRVWITLFGRKGQHLGAIYEANPRKLVVWRLADRTPVLESSDARLHYWDFTSDNRVVIVLENELAVFRLGEHEPIQTISLAPVDEQVACRNIASHPTQNTIAVALDIPQPTINDEKSASDQAEPSGRLVIVDLDTEETQSLAVPESIGSATWVGPENLVAITYKSGLIEVRDLSEPETPVGQLHGHTARVTWSGADMEGRTLLTYAWDGSLRLWDVRTQRQLTRVNGFNVITMSNTEVNDRLALWRNKTPQLWEVYRGGVLRCQSLKAPFIKSDNSGVAAHPKIENLVIVTTKAGYELWDLARAERIGELARSKPNGLAMVENGRAFLICAGNGIERWPIRFEGKDVTQVTVGPPRVVAAEIQEKTAFHDTHTWATMDRPDRATIYIDGKAQHEIEHSHLSSLRFSPDGKTLATHAWHGLGINIWNVATGELVAELMPESVSPRGAFTPNGQYFVANGRTERVVFETQDWTPLHEMARAVPDGWPGKVATANDNRTAMLNHSRNRLELFDLIDGQTIAILEPSEISPRTAGCFSSQGGWLLTFGEDGPEIWDLCELRSQLGRMQLDWQPPAASKSEAPPIEFTLLHEPEP